MSLALTIRDIRESEFGALGNLLVKVYAVLEGFPSPQEQPRYYEMLANIGDFTRKPKARVLVATRESGELLGGRSVFRRHGAVRIGW